MLRRWRWLVVALSSLVVIVLGAWFGAAWHYSNVLNEEALDAAARREALAEVEIDDTTVILVDRSGEPGVIAFARPEDPESEVLRDGTWGVEWEGGYGLAGQIIDSDDESVSRQFTLLEGREPAAGAPVEFESRAVPRDGGQFYRQNAEIVNVPGPLGDYPTRYVPGELPTWVLLVNGNSLDWRDLARLGPSLYADGYPMLFVTLRNSPGAPEDPSGHLTYGETEWQDLDAAIKYALANGAGDVAIIAASMGGGVVMSLFVNVPESVSAVTAVVLDSPMLSFERAVEFQAADVELPLIGVGLPGALTETAEWLTSRRFDVDWEATDYLDDGASLTVPALIIHGEADDDVPIATSREFAAANPDNVTLVEVPGATHIASWNAGPGTYESRLLDFLASHLVVAVR